MCALILTLNILLDQFLWLSMLNSEMFNSEIQWKKYFVVFIALIFYHSALVAENNETDDSYEVIIVTARKKPESIQEVPLTVIAIPARKIEDFGIKNLQELSTYVAGLEQPKLPIQSRLSLRGVSSGDNASFEQAVGVYVDGIYRGRMHQHRSGFFDLERIEVLHGPQVTLYGNSSIGGAISMLTKRPEFEFGGHISAAYEFEYDERVIDAAINLPVSDTFALRIATKYRQDEGIAYNAFNGQNEPQADDQSWRVSAKWLINDSVTVNIRHEQGQYELDGHMLDVLKHVDGNGNPWPDSPFTGFDDNILNVGNAALFEPLDTFWVTEVEETALEIEYSMDRNTTLKSITGYSTYDYQQSLDSDLTPLSIINTFLEEDYQQFSQEFRLTGVINNHLNYLVGAYYQQDDFNSDYYADFNTPLLLSGMLGVPTEVTSSLISPFSRLLSLKQDTDQWAVMGHINYFPTDKMEVSLSYRYVDLTKKAKQSAATTDIQHVATPGDLVDTRWLSPDLAPLLLTNPDYLSDPTNFVLNIPGMGDIAPALAPDHILSYSLLSGGTGIVHNFSDLERRENQSMYQLSFRYQLNDQSMIYTSFASGAKAGGFDLVYEGDNRDEVEYEDEKAKVFELGLKNDWDNVRLNVATFYGNYDNLQVAVFNGGIGFTVDNAPSSTSKGIDAELTWHMTDNLAVYTNMEYLDFAYDRYEQANCSVTERLNTGNILCDWSGRTVPFVPKFKGSLSLEHNWKINSDYELRHLLTYSYKGKHGTASDNEIQTMQKSYSLVDYRIDLQNSSVQNWKIGLAVKNLFDTDFTSMTTVIPLAPGGAFAYQVEKGRQVSLELGVNF